MTGLLQAQSKLNAELLHWYLQVPEEQADTLSLPLLIKGDPERLPELIRAAGGYVKHRHRGIASAVLPVRGISELLRQPLIERMEAYFQPLHHFYHEDSSVFYNNRVSPVHQGWGNLPQGYRGEGVLVGIIDDGFEWRHPDFKHPDGRSRIRYLWDQTAVNPPFWEAQFGYGAAWDSTAIDAGQCSQIAYDHGSHVAGIAAGNGLAADIYPGIAPRADLACVRILDNSAWMTAFVDGMYYIYQKADSLAMPCVINSSLGTYGSGHDGKDLYSQWISNLLDDNPGKLFVQAGGNAREYAFHLGVALSGDTARTGFIAQPQGYTRFLLYSDTADFNQIEFSFQWVDSLSGLPLASSAWYNLPRDVPLSASGGQLEQLLFYNSNGSATTLGLYVSEYQGTYEVFVLITQPTAAQQRYWQLTTRGTGKYDVWSHPQLTGTSRILELPAPLPPKYRNPDNRQSIAGFWTCATPVITVGAYQNQSFHINYNQDTMLLNADSVNFPTGGIWFRSSRGGTRDGRLKPDICAPGGQVISAASIYYLDLLHGLNHPRLDRSGWHIPNQGTSMAAPMVAGALALYLQCQPQTNQTQARYKLYQSARIDSLVLREGALPNPDWGYGKLDVYELVKSCLVYGCTDTAAINYNPQAMIDDGSCIVFPPQALAETADPNALPSIQPQPVRQDAVLSFPPLQQNTALRLYNAQGQLLEEYDLQPGAEQLHWQRRQQPSGLYYWQWYGSKGERFYIKMLLIND